MKIGFDKKKSTEALVGLMQNTFDAGKKLADSAKDGVALMVEKSKNDSVAKKIKKYNPLFPEEFRSDEFRLPKVIMIVDDVERRDIDVCQGAMGWRSQENKIEILWLYEKDVALTGIRFYPEPKINGVYYVDRFDCDSYVLADELFNKAQDEKVAELEHVANSLGAKRCVIDIKESSGDVSSQHKKANVDGLFKGIRIGGAVEEKRSESGKRQDETHVETEFEGTGTPCRPKLKWFAETKVILELIEDRCNNRVKKKTIAIKGDNVSVMDNDTAQSIDAAVGKQNIISSSFAMASKASKENHSTLYFYVEF